MLTRLLGPSRGVALTGLSGGLVSSTAVTLSFSRDARDHPPMANAIACGILLAWAVMFVRVPILVAVVNRALLSQLLLPFVVMAVVVAAFAALLYFREGSVERGEVKEHLEVKNPFSLIAAAKFAALFAVVLLAVKIVQQHFPPDGLYAVAALAGLGEACVAVISIVIAALSNTLVKCGMAFAVAGLALGKPLLMATVATLLAGLAAALLM
jgi:uncharacterized membrane protein (DUF4010 family)